MRAPRMRPTFVLPLDAPDGFLPSLRGALEEARAQVRGTLFRRHAVLTIVDAERHFWSPHLYLEIREGDAEDEDTPDGPHLHGRFAPHPHVWTMFMAIYGLLAMGGVAGAVWGFSVWTLGEAPWTLLAVPGSIGLIAFTYGAAFIGQGLGAAQMYHLRKVVDRALEVSEGEARGPAPSELAPTSPTATET